MLLSEHEPGTSICEVASARKASAYSEEEGYVMLYTIGDAAKKLGVQPSALRYYDKEGLLPHMERSDGGMRMFTEDDFEWFRFIERLKKSGMPLKEIKEFIDLYEQGDSTIEQRRELIHVRKKEVERQMAELQETLDFITYKCWYYDVAAKAGSTKVHDTMSLEEIPPEIQEIKEHCGVNKYQM